jgi:hypothetical protein
MIEAIAAIGSLPKAVGDVTQAGPEAVALHQPSQAEAADFAHAVGNSPFVEINAAPSAGSDNLSARLAAQANQLSAHLQALGPSAAQGDATAAHAAGSHPLADARSTMGDAVAQIERAYMFAIETTMASRGSTETTKIFNTLLKGQ